MPNSKVLFFSLTVLGSIALGWGLLDGFSFVHSLLNPKTCLSAPEIELFICAEYNPSNAQFMLDLAQCLVPGIFGATMVLVGWYNLDVYEYDEEESGKDTNTQQKAPSIVT